MSLSSLPLLMQALSGPLAIERRTLDAFLGVLRQRQDGVSFSGPELHAELNIAMPRSAQKVSAERNVQVIPVLGAIANRAQSMGTGADRLGAQISAAVEDPRIDAIVLDIDSPGGTVTGVPELAARIFAARGTKPIIAQANGMMASAAYWIGAAADEVVASPSSLVGSIGVFSLHTDVSQALENEGVKVTEISAGKYKTEGAPWRALDAEAEEHFRGEVMEAYNWFTRDVAAFRGDTQANVKAGYGEGRVLPAKEAKAAKLVDRIATLDETIARLASGAGSRSRTRADAELRKMARARSA